MDLLQVAVTSVGAFVALFLLSKLMGHRQISELSVFDYVNGITIGSIAAEMATELEKPLRPLVAMVVWALLVWLLEALTSKCPRLRKYISGAPSIHRKAAQQREDATAGTACTSARVCVTIT